ncbi:hypothetical protein KAR91_33945 [Candidatus Pacearchaeota archaeon]|nr:hypothetical protein [Candidatus Pacearchaeota archaeon]
MKYKDINLEEIKMSGSRILIRTEKQKKGDGFEKTDSGILVAKSSETGEKDPGNIAEVFKVGPDVMDQINIIAGVNIIHQPYTGFKFSNGNYDYTVLSEQDVLAIL